MKKLILFLVLLSCCVTAALAGESKIAIIGDSPAAEKTADLALTELSDKKGIAVLERREIDKLLREHKLTRSGMTAMELASFARIAHVDIFAVINSAVKNKKNISSSLLVFDAKTGFQLRDVILTGRLDEDVKTISSTVIAASAQLRQIKRISYVAILAVRNAGVPSKYKYNMENIATEVRRRLVAAPDIAVLERSRLGLVLKERKLSKNQYKLLPSAYLLDFEFTQGSSANIVNLKFYIMSTDGKILKKYTYADSLAKTSELISKIINDLGKWLNKPLTGNISSARQEATRYFGEYGFYKQLKKYQIAKSKLESAIALVPNNIKYLVEYQKAIVNAVTNGRRMSREKRLGEYVKAGYAIISNGDLIHNLAPDNREWIFNQHTLFEKMYNLYEWQNRERNLELISPEQLRLAAKMFDKLRSKALEENKRLWLKFDLSNGINSAKELKNYAAYLEVSVRQHFYCNFNKMLKRYFENIVLLTKAYKTYNRNHPPERINPLPLMSPHASSDFFDALVLQFKSEDAQKAIDACKNYPGNSLKYHALLLEFYRKCAFGGFEKNNFSKNLDWWFAQHDKNTVPSRFLLILTVANLKPELAKIYRQKRKLFLAKRTSNDPWKLIYAKLNGAGDIDSIAKIIIKHNTALQKWRRANNKDNRIDISDTPANVIRKISGRLSYSLISRKFKGDKKLLRQALETLNMPLKVSLVEKIYRTKKSALENAYLYEQSVYLLGRNNRNATIYAFDLNSGKVKELGEYKEVFSDQHYIERVSHTLLPFYVNDNFFIIGGAERITIISRHDSRVSHIDDLPALYVHALTMFNKRIYAFVGAYRKMNILLSCKVDGNDRKVHISTLRRDKQNIFDRQKYFYQSGLFADEKHQRIIFAAGSKVAGLWEFYPKTDRFNKVISYRDTYSVNARRLNNAIYLAANGNYSNYYIFNMDDNSFDFAYFNDHPQRTKWLKDKPRYAEWLNLHPPFYVKDNDFWAGGFGAVFVDLKTGDGMYSIYGIDRGMGRMGGDASILFFPCPDSRDVYAVNRSSIYRITPPPNSGIKENK